MTRIICGVDVDSEMLDAQVGGDGAWQQFAQGVGHLERTDRIECGLA